MKIFVDSIRDVPFLIHVDEPVDSFPLLLSSQTDSVCLFTGRVTGNLTVTNEHGCIRVSGMLSVPIELYCSRCLEPFPSEVSTSFTIFFRKDTSSLPKQDDELELTEMDLLSSVYSGDEINLTSDLEEQIAMEIPLKALCSDACKGLCHDCGADMNKSSCSCSGNKVGLAFSVLKNFKVSQA